MEAATIEKRGLAALLEALSPLKNRNYALLMSGRLGSEMGRTIRVYARAWLVLQKTQSPFLLGLVTSAISWPMLFIPFLGGVLADEAAGIRKALAEHGFASADQVEIDGWAALHLMR